MPLSEIPIAKPRAEIMDGLRSAAATFAKAKIAHADTEARMFIGAWCVVYSRPMADSCNDDE
jgi:hypothetical protein